MLLQLDFTIDTPIYRQIHDQFVLGIAEGRLLPGEKMPSIRALANETGVNMMTVNKAYQLLKQEGYISGDRRGGTAVCGHSDARSDELSKVKTFDELRLLAASAKHAGITRETWLDLCEKTYDGKERK